MWDEQLLGRVDGPVSKGVKPSGWRNVGLVQGKLWGAVDQAQGQVTCWEMEDLRKMVQPNTCWLCRSIHCKKYLGRRMW